MAIHIDKVANLRVVKTPFFTPINKDNKRFGSVIFVLAPNKQSVLKYIDKTKSKETFMVNLNMFESLYEERDVSYFITDKGLQTQNGEVLENTQDWHLLQKQFITEDTPIVMTPNFIMNNEQVIFNENATDTKLKQYLFRDRYKTAKEINQYYDEIKENTSIKYTYLDIKRYKERNLFVTMNKYMELFINKNTLKTYKAINAFHTLMNRFLLNSKYNNYTKKTVIIPVADWIDALELPISTRVIIHSKTKVNPFNVIFQAIKIQNTDWKNINFIFIGNNGWFRYDFTDTSKITKNKFIISLNTLVKNTVVEDNQPEDTEDKATTYLSKIEDKTNIKIDHITGNNDQYNDASVNKDSDKTSVESKISNTIKREIENNDSETAIENDLNNDSNFKALLMELRSQEEAKVKRLSPERHKRFNELNNKFINSQLDGKKIEDLLDVDNVELKEVNLDKVDSIDDEWKGLTHPNFEKQYDLDADIVKCINAFGDSKKDIQMKVVELSKTDTSSTEDSIDTYKVTFEDSLNKRHTLTFDVPKIINNRFLRLRGNDKVLSGQLMNLPIIKTDADTVQVVSNYNKIFIILNKPIGKASQRTDAMIRSLNKIIETDYKDPSGETKCNYIKKIITGNNTKISRKYKLPMEYIELASFFNKIETKEFSIYFNQDEFHEKFKDKLGKSTMACMSYKDRNNSSFEHVAESIYSVASMDDYVTTILNTLLRDEYFNKLYNKFYTTQKAAAFSEASILSSKIPLIIVLAYSVGLTEALKRAKIKYDFQEKRPSKTIPFIKFKDGYLVYEDQPEDIILMNGLYKFNTEDYSIKDVDSKTMWLEALDDYGAKYKADGLDSFYNVMMDPISVEVCKHYQLPYEYIEALAYANSLLVTNDFNRHVDITGNRFRTNERIAHFVYKALSTSYGNYLREVKNNRKDAKMTIKRSAVIDLAMQDSTMSDLSMLTPLLELESANTLSFKGLSGMNSDRSYQLDKRTYDKSMLNKIAMSTGFAANVGISRQATINMDVTGTKGYLYNKENELDSANDANTLSITEALTPLGTTHDDPFRTAMTFIQTAKHGIRTAKSDPLLVSNGADQALPYLTSNMFAFKAKDNGKIVEIKPDYMKVKYKNGNTDIIDLRKHIEKNSDGGFFIELKLDTDLKVGNSFKANDIIAYDKLSYSRDFGTETLTYNIGKLAKIAMMVTDEGFEDSASISEALSEQMSSDIVVKLDVLLDKSDIVIFSRRPDTNVIEGENIFTYVNAVDDPDAERVLSKLFTDKAAVENLGNITIKSKVTGVLDDIKVYSTVDTKEMSKSLRKFVESIYDREDKYLKSVNKPIPERVLPPIGKLKNSEDKVLIEFYMKYKDDLSVGDKIVFFSALKGTIKRIYPKGKEPRSEYRKNETIKSLLPLSGVNARMVGSVPILIALNKVIIELDRHVKDIMGVPYNDGLDN